MEIRYLSDDILPIKYNLHLNVDVSNKTKMGLFTGTNIIELNVKSNTDKFEFNTLDLVLHHIEIDNQSLDIEIFNGNTKKKL
jgi:hypothetical protein